ncbi:MAG: hypothetical protein A2W29_13055 [Gemmatimonadetes bacterium RBG_16_66_8]|nr:MAG: hypothetical protein A2W29_13055 [Gemmatimonadetes bacterium RBG_16_66_8]
MITTVLFASRLEGQAEFWRHKWYWGAQGGVAMFQTPTAAGTQTGLTVGGHWLITATRSALYLAFDQMMFGNTATSAVVDASALNGIRTVAFTNGRRLQAMAFVIPTDKLLQVYVGGGFGIHQITDARPLGTFNTISEQESVFRTLESTGTKAFPILGGGAQYRRGKLALFGQYQFMPEGRDFLLSGVQHVFSGGIRYALTGSREEITTER